MIADLVFCVHETLNFLNDSMSLRLKRYLMVVSFQDLIGGKACDYVVNCTAIW